jgi:putative transposase
MQTFFCHDDFQTYCKLLARYKTEAAVTIWAYCLMPNHVHLIVVPERTDSLARLFSQVHRRYTRYINAREDWRGHLWQERFHSFVMDENHLIKAVRYTELNPVRAGMCRQARDWPWSSARAHLLAKDNGIVSVEPMRRRVSNWASYLSVEGNTDDLELIRRHGRTGRPAGSDAFVEKLEGLTGKDLKKGKPGPKRPVK